MNSKEHQLLLEVDSECEESVLMWLNNGADVNWRDRLGRTALSRASLVGNKNIVKIIIEIGEDINNTDVSKHTPVYIAVIDNRSEILKLLIQSNADVNQRVI